MSRAISTKRKIGAMEEITWLSAKDMKKGQKVCGEYVGIFENENGKSYKIRTDNGLIGLNGTGQLNYIMEQAQPGQYVEVTYAGKIKLNRGTWKGKASHQFEVEVADYVDGSHTTTTKGTTAKTTAKPKLAAASATDEDTDDTFDNDDETSETETEGTDGEDFFNDEV